MEDFDLGPILDDLAAGRIDAAEANVRIEALKKQTKDTGTPDPDDKARSRGAAGLERVSVTAVGRRLRIEADPGVSTLVAEGPHILRRNGKVMEVSSTGDFGPTFGGFSFIRPPRSLDDLRDIGLGKELFIRVNPDLLVDVELTTGGLKVTGVPRLGRVRVTGGSCTLENVTEVADLLAQAGGVTVDGPISSGRSRLRVESGNLVVNLADDANVTVHAKAKFGRINWPDDQGSDDADEVVFGNGSARMDIDVVMGFASIRTKEHKHE